jgi:hypothetical protein
LPRTWEDCAIPLSDNTGDPKQDNLYVGMVEAAINADAPLAQVLKKDDKGAKIRAECGITLDHCECFKQASFWAAAYAMLHGKGEWAP